MTLLISVHVVVCIFLVAIILVQPGKGDAGIGFGSSSQSIFGSRGAGNFFTRATSVCAVIFLATSFFLTRSRMQQYSSSVISAPTSSETSAPAKDEPAMEAPAAPVEENTEEGADPE